MSSQQTHKDCFSILSWAAIFAFVALTVHSVTSAQDIFGRISGTVTDCIGRSRSKRQGDAYNPTTNNAGAASFGQITTLLPARVLQFGAKFVF